MSELKPSTAAAQIKKYIPEIQEKLKAGMTYKEIELFFKEKGIKIDHKNIRTILHRYRRKKGEVLEHEESVPQKILPILPAIDRKIREEGVSYKAVIEYFKHKGVDVSESNFRVLLYSYRAVVNMKSPVKGYEYVHLLLPEDEAEKIKKWAIIPPLDL